MIDNTCMGEEFTVTADDFTQDILKEIYSASSGIKGLKKKRVKGYKECLFTFSNDQNKEEFIQILTLNVVNSYMIYLLCDYCATLGVQPDVQEEIMPGFFDVNTDTISYINVVGKLQMNLFVGSNNVLDIPKFWKFNLSALKKEWNEFLQHQEQEILEMVINAVNSKDAGFLSVALAAKEVFQKNMPNSIGHELFKIYDDVEFGEIFILDGNKEIDVNMAIPMELDSIISPEQLMSLEDDRLLELLLILWEPKKVILYNSLHPKTKLKIQKFYTENKELFPNTELYTTDEDVPQDGEQTVFRDGNDDDGEDD